MFWQKWLKKATEKTASKPKLRPPIDLPQPVGRHLVVVLGKDPDWVWKMKAVVRPVEGGEKSEQLIRIFDPQSALSKGIKVHNYDALDGHPELIICEGRFNKDSNQLELRFNEVPQAA